MSESTFDQRECPACGELNWGYAEDDCPLCGAGPTQDDFAAWMKEQARSPWPNSPAASLPKLRQTMLLSHLSDLPAQQTMFEDKP